MKTIILGIGNLILSDDGVGIHVARELKKRIKNKDNLKNEFCIFLKDYRRFTLWISDEDKKVLLENLDKDKLLFPDELEDEDTK